MTSQHPIKKSELNKFRPEDMNASLEDIESMLDEELEMANDDGSQQSPLTLGAPEDMNLSIDELNDKITESIEDQKQIDLDNSLSDQAFLDSGNDNDVIDQVLGLTDDDLIEGLNDSKGLIAQALHEAMLDDNNEKAIIKAIKEGKEKLAKASEKPHVYEQSPLPKRSPSVSDLTNVEPKKNSDADASKKLDGVDKFLYLIERIINMGIAALNALASLVTLSADNKKNLISYVDLSAPKKVDVIIEKPPEEPKPLLNIDNHLYVDTKRQEKVIKETVSKHNSYAKKMSGSYPGRGAWSNPDESLKAKDETKKSDVFATKIEPVF